MTLVGLAIARVTKVKRITAKDFIVMEMGVDEMY